MFIVLGASGNVGSATVQALTGLGHKVIAVVHSPEKMAAFSWDLVEPVVCDVSDAAALRTILQRGKRAFLLNPPGNKHQDSNADELATAKTITEALDGSGLEKIVVASTYGAQAGEATGDLTTLYDFEQRATASGIPAAINRGSYYFTNLDILLESAREGIVPTVFPADFELPMVAPADLGAFAAERLTSPIEDVGIAYVEGPERYTFNDVARAFARQFGRDVLVQTTPPDHWEENFQAVGFSPLAARSFARMTAATLQPTDTPTAPRRGKVMLDNYIANLAERALHSAE